MTTEIRELLTEAEHLQGHRMGNFVFGRNADFVAPSEDPRRSWGVFDGDELYAKLGVRPYEQYFGGKAVPMGGVCGVAVAPEHRGKGHAQALLQHSLEQMRAAGQVISALHPTAVGLYRAIGWEFGGSCPRIRLRMSTLARARGGEDISIRRCTEADISEVERLYAQHASSRNGMLTRVGPAFPDGAADILTELDGVPLAIREGEVVGYASYQRGEGMGERAQIAVYDLIGIDGPAVAALLRHISGWESVSPFATLRVSPDDVATLVLPDATPPAHECARWMLRLVDVAGALTARGYRANVEAVVELDIVDEHAEWNRGPLRLTVKNGRAEVSDTATGGARIDVRGLAALYSCAYSASALQQAGLLSANADQCAALDLIFGSQPSVMWDFF